MTAASDTTRLWPVRLFSNTRIYERIGGLYATRHWVSGPVKSAGKPPEFSISARMSGS